MGKRIYDNQYGFQTRAVHTGNDVDSETGAIKRPITMANSYELPYDSTDVNWSSAAGNLYTRNGGSNQKYLQEKLASLEGGKTVLCWQAVLLRCPDCFLPCSKVETTLSFPVLLTLQFIGF